MRATKSCGGRGRGFPPASSLFCFLLYSALFIIRSVLYHTMVDLPVPSPPLLSSPSAPGKRPASSPPPVHAHSPPPPASKKPATAPKRKAARSQLPAAEQQPAVLPSHYRLPLQGAEVYYLPEFVTAETASGWYDALLGVEGCESCRLRRAQEEEGALG